MGLNGCSSLANIAVHAPYKGTSNNHDSPGQSPVGQHAVDGRPRAPALAPSSAASADNGLCSVHCMLGQLRRSFH